MPLPSRILVDDGGIPTHLFFGTAVDFNPGQYPIERVHLELVRESIDGHQDTALFHYAGRWQLEYRDTAAQAWAHILAPKDVWSDDAAIGEIRSGCFWGQVRVDAQTKSVQVHGVIRRIGKGPIIGEWANTARVEQAHLKRPTSILPSAKFELIPDPENSQFLLQGQLGRRKYVSIYLTDVRSKLVGILDDGYLSGRYSRVLNFGNRSRVGYEIHVRIGDEEQVIQIP